MNPNNSAVETIDDKQFYQLGSNLLHSIEVALESADDELDLDLDVERQGGNVINIRFRDKSVIVVNTQPPLHEIWVAAKSGGYHYRWAGTLAQPLWLDTKTGKELLSDLSEFASTQAGQPIKIELMK
ncbi:iron donor protein CyaY [Polynucleobacter asymbioticus]|uniref:Iron-sulfur cluster assembly protein CyaY n=1 Tax=Polynucleobacter asymbioticus (strain DSM 18221 / CIP 109841 / QLW-P1DMWA-1) TaxID=312153 RepID=A4SUZ5_POLAQ|nr:iron donor protein CyaY [Polynucleobacter asymbioticus]ABP33309.1 Frataxin family protein [Polynucleobacter asymbioticus QLW-P1DMWA-1]APC07049.1 iron donor protein CyaY [Polynucleobacter asymbioticus]